MPACFICGTELAAGAASCSVCGTATPDLAAQAPSPDPTGVRLWVPPATGKRICPACRRRYDAGRIDVFCDCGAGLVPDLELELLAPGPVNADVALPEGAEPRLVVYDDDLEPIHTLPLDRDVTRIGRNDPVRGDFVELDIAALFDAAAARKVSRKHALVLRLRETGTYLLRPLARNTGTQIGGELARELVDYPLAAGTRIVLGGAVRLKFLVHGTDGIME